ncbi:DUF6794 domain-containing protein [Ulvibacterium sp.]|uniref:DUF6794 domain-containing protein n=1 Tax=Ulvibacterium sp. TaxID=2665914 RepID=UPI003CC6314F
MNTIESSWSMDELEDFVRKPDSIALPEVHFGQALVFRNKELRNPEDSTLLKYFHSLGVYHEDYMSSIVFTSLHRKLNDKPIELENQLKNIHLIMNGTAQRENQNTKRALYYYNKYKEGDTIFIRMPLSNGKSATRHSYPEDSNWVYNDTTDLLMKGIIKEKEELKDTFNMYFKFKILSINHKNIKFLSDEISVGDEIESDFRLDIIQDSMEGNGTK